MEPIGWLERSMSDYFNMQPSTVKGDANDAVAFNRRYLFNKIFSVYKFKLPKEWAINFFRFWLFEFGSLGVIYTKEFGWIMNPYSVKKLDLYHQPAVIEVTNHALKTTKTGVIGVNAGIIRLMDDYFGLYDIVNKYAVELAQIDKAANINLMNCNVSLLFEADSKKQAEEIKEAYAKATEGNPLVVVNKDVLGGESIKPMFNGAAGQYIVDKLLTARRTIVNNFLTEIGIRNANYDKKERLNSMEVSENNDETRALVSVIFENLKDSFERINAISGLGLEVELRYNYNEEQEGPVNEQINS